MIALMTPKDVCKKTTFSRPTIDRFIAEGRFPKPIRLSERRIAFNATEIEEWIAARIRESVG
jgi:prophage regulatory protein